jgi:hypothetical protein
MFLVVLGFWFYRNGVNKIFLSCVDRFKMLLIPRRYNIQYNDTCHNGLNCSTQRKRQTLKKRNVMFGVTFFLSVLRLVLLH